MFVTYAASPESQPDVPAQFRMEDLLKCRFENEDWKCCLLPANQLEAWAQIKHFLHVYVVGKTSDNAFYQAAVCKCRMQWLLDNDVPFQLESEQGFHYKLWEPSDGESGVHGLLEAKNKARRRFLRDAIDGIYSGRGRKLDQYYRQHTLDPQILASIEFAILIRDITNSSREVLNRFLACYHDILSGVDRRSAHRQIESYWKTWEHSSRKLSDRIVMQPGVDATAVMHQASLLRGLLEFAGGQKDPFQHKFDMDQSVNANIALLGLLLDVELTEPLSFGSSEVSRMSKTLENRQCDICPNVPIGFGKDVYEALPVDLIHNLGYGTVESALSQIDNTYKQVPSLKEPESGLLMLLCHCMSLKRSDPVLHRWVTSEDGRSLYQRIMTTMREESQTAEQVVLRLAGLLCYDLLLDSPDDVESPINGSYLRDFDLFLKEHELKNRRVVLERMAVSVMRVVGDTCHPAVRCFLDTFVGAGPQLHWFDEFSDRYWSHNLDRGLAQ